MVVGRFHLQLQEDRDLCQQRSLGIGVQTCKPGSVDHEPSTARFHRGKLGWLACVGDFGALAALQRRALLLDTTHAPAIRERALHPPPDALLDLLARFRTLLDARVPTDKVIEELQELERRAEFEAAPRVLRLATLVIG